METFERIREVVGDRIFHPQEVAILRRLAQSYPIGLTILEVSMRDRGTTGKRLKALESDGYVERSHGRYVITAKGIALVRILAAHMKSTENQR